MERENVKEILKAARENKGLSKAALAKEVGISPSTYNMYEMGGSIPRNMDTLKKICSVLDIHLETLGFFDLEIEDDDYRKIERIHDNRLLLKSMETINSIMKDANELSREYNTFQGYDYKLSEEDNDANGHIQDPWISQSFYFDIINELDKFKEQEERKIKLTRHLLKMLTRPNENEE